MSLPGSPLVPQSNPSRGTRFLHYFALAFLFVCVGIVGVALTNKAVIWSSSDSFCGQFCHSMIWASAAYKKAPHYQNAIGVRASCGDCHIPYDSSHATATEYVYLLAFKANRGAKDFYHEATRSMSTEKEWEDRRPALAAEFENFITQHNYITCRGCHQLNAFGGPHSVMKQMIHQRYATSNAYDCLHCHSDIGHVYSNSASTTPGQPATLQPAPESIVAAAVPSSSASGDWYSTEQAADGSKLYAQNCASCHGAKLNGGGGPALTGASWKQLYPGSKLLTVWGEIHGPMAQYAGATFTEQQSLDILSFLLQQNGLPAGSKPLRSTTELNRTLPK